MRVCPALLGLFVVSLAASAQTPAPPTSAPAPPAASGSLTTYHSDPLKLTYSYPAAFKDATDMVGPAFQASISHNDAGAKEDDLRCVTLPFSAMDSADGKISMVLLVRADAGCMKKTFTAAQLSQFTKGEVTGLTASGAHAQFGEPANFTTAGHPAQLIRGTFALPTGQKMNAMVACVLVSPDVACWQFLASSDEALRTMSAFPVSFDGGQPAPLIPPDTIAKP